MYYIESPSTDPYFNLALEQYVFDHLGQEQPCFMLWQNDNTIVVGKHQNTIGEINPAFVKEHGIRVARRLSGGGAVYHDMGNINFTFVAKHDGDSFNFSTFCIPVINALESMGVPAEVSGRNDMTIHGQKFSGNSQYVKHGHIMHHGTIMYDSDLSVVAKALNVPKDKIESKGLQSVRSRITNVKPHVQGDFTTQQFFNRLKDFMFKQYPLQTYTLSEEDIKAVQTLQQTVYSQWAWNYGASPAYKMHKERRVEGCGKLEIYMDVQDGILKDLAFYGDYFGDGDTTELVRRLVGSTMEESEIRRRIETLDIGLYFNNMDADTFCSILMQ